jgi:hypothetical protein
VADGTRIYSDALFSDFIETSDGTAWIYVATDPINTTVPDFPGLKTYAAVTKNPLTHHALAVYDNASWYFSDGQFYWENAPEGAYQLTNLEYATLTNLIGQGKTLGWYANQRPYIYEAWTHPGYGSNNDNPDGAVFTASSEASNRNAYKAMNGAYGGTGLDDWRPDVEGPAWWQVFFPFKIMITFLKHHNCHRTGSQIGAAAGIVGHYFADAAETIPIGDTFDSGGASGSSTTGQGEYTVYDSTVPIITDTIRLNKISGTGGDSRGSAGIGEADLIASKIIYEVAER